MASPLLVEPSFYRTVILLLEHGDEGAFGLVLNRPSEEPVAAHLPEWSPMVGEPGLIHVGGPVDAEVAIGLTSGISDVPTALPGVSMVDLEEDPSPGTGLIRIYSGYSGWSAGQLESELREGAWYVVDAAPDDPFADPLDQWSRILRRQRGRLAMVAHYPVDPALN